MLSNPGGFSYRCAPARTPLQSARPSHPTEPMPDTASRPASAAVPDTPRSGTEWGADRSEEHTSELQSPDHLLCRPLLEKKKRNNAIDDIIRSMKQSASTNNMTTLLNTAN